MSRFHHQHLLAVDSYGCVFDGMSIKQRLAFIPAAIEVFNLGKERALYTEIAEEVNLHSNLRGINRFAALFCCLFLTQDLAKSPLQLPELQPLGEFVSKSNALSTYALSLFNESQPAEILSLALAWSNLTNATMARISGTIPVFAEARNALQAGAKVANLMVCSAGSRQSLQNEWGAAGIETLVSVITGQEFGPKAKQMLRVAEMGGFPLDKVLMIGDSLGDLQAARNAGVRFFPVIPGEEDSSWKLFSEQILPAFHQGAYTVETEAKLVEQLEMKLSPFRYADRLSAAGTILPA